MYMHMHMHMHMHMYMYMYMYMYMSVDQYYCFLEMVSSRIITFLSRDFRPHFRATCLRWQ